MKKIAIFSNGTATVYENGEARQASSKEVQNYLVSLVSPKKGGAELTAVKYENGYVHAKYASGKTFRKKIAQQTSTNQTEPINSVEKSDPDVKVPRKKEKAKPQDIKGRSDVNNPTEVRKKEYNRGDADGHTDAIPRSIEDSGLKGSKKTKFSPEKGDKATSGNPDNYVQDFTKSEKPESAGSEMNHAANSEIEIRQESEIYQRIKVATEEERNKKNKDEEKDEEKDEKSKSDNLHPWLDKDEDDDEKDNEEKNDKEAELKAKLDEAQAELAKKQEEIDKLKIRANRQKSSIKLTLAYRDINPEKYASADSFCSKVDEVAKTMNVKAAETAYAELVALSNDAFRKSQETKKTASNADGLVSVAFNAKKDNYAEENEESLKDLLMNEFSMEKKFKYLENEK